jgi:sugar phosphate permease
MKKKAVAASPYRWIVLAVFMLAAAVNQLCWIVFAPITSTAMSFYGTSDLMIGLLSMVFMIVYMIVVLPSAWMIDNWGFRAAVGIGTALTAAGALGRGIFARSFPAVFAFQVLIALGQPLILGAVTKLAARWFPKEERATASGLGTLSFYIGILLGLVCTPSLASRFGIPGMLLVYGGVSLAVAVIFILVSRERPSGVPDKAGAEVRTLVFTGLKNMLADRSFALLLVIFFIGLGAFNGITTWIEQILAPRGFDASQAGTAGGLMLAGGIVGAFVIPLVSDSMRRRKPFILIALIGLLPGLAGIAFARGYGLLLFSSFCFGFFLLSSGPIGFQYAAEITYPAPEGTSNSFLLVMGQISGIAIIFAMDAFKASDGSMTVSLFVLLALMALSVLIACLLRESPIAKRKQPAP